MPTDDRPSDALKAHARMRSCKRLLFVLGDQLDLDAAALQRIDKEHDAILMAEVKHEATHVPSHKQRTALFLAAMRHYAADLIDRGYRVRYTRLDDSANEQTLAGELMRAIGTLSPELVIVTEPGEHRVRRDIERACADADAPLDIEPDESFTAALEDFDDWADDGRKTLTMEYFYRERRRALDVLMTSEGKPEGGKWNFDHDNRETFSKTPRAKAIRDFRPDAMTREVLELVERVFPDAPGNLDGFRWPVTHDEARTALRDFIDNRLHKFGTYEDAMWTEQPYLYHAVLSPAFNLKLLRPMDAVDAAVEAYRSGKAAMNNVEGFVRQLIGWREFIRGVYFHEGDDYAERNALEQDGDLPEFFWTGETDMRCLRECLGSVIDHAYSHHIPRLMVIGNFALIAGVHATQIEEWFLAMYADAVEWATAPNVVGMSQHADGPPEDHPSRRRFGAGGLVGTKPYASSGKYISRMSNFCEHCRYDVNKRTGEDACPFNALYWHFLIRHEERFKGNNRMAMVMKNVERMSSEQRTELTVEGDKLRERFGVTS